MICSIHRVQKMVVITTLILTITGCSVFISTPRVARIQMQRLDNKFVEYVVNLEDPGKSNLDVRLNNEYSLHLDFHWLWYMNIRPETYYEADSDFEDPLLIPWMLCEYRF